VGKKRKRSNGQGTIYQVGSKWIAQVTYVVNGDIKRPKRTCDKHADAVVKLQELQALASQQVDDQSHTVKSYLNDWIDEREQTGLSTSTIISYRNNSRLHIIPRLGNRRLNQLKPTHINAMLKSLRDNKTGTRAVELSFVILNAALESACKHDIIARNPCKSITRPVHKQEEPIPFSLEERKAIFEEVAGEFFEPLYKVILSTGLRSTEAFGLEWCDIDKKAKVIHVRRKFMHKQIEPLKSKHSVRTLDITDGIQAALDQQKALLKRKGFQKNKHIFCAAKGGYIDNTTHGRRYWNKLLERAGVEVRGLHHLRHTFATELLGNNVPVHVVSRLLGHSSPTVTYNYYAHAIPAQRSQAADKIQDIFG